MCSKKTVLVVAAIVAVVGIEVAGQGRPQYKLGGAFIGSNGLGNTWTGLQIPLDPAGMTAALRVNMTYYNAGLAGFLARFGADTVSEYVGEEKMISRDTAQYWTVAYATQQGNPPQLRLIVVMSGTVQFTGPDDQTVNYTWDVYLASADADLDGYPDEGAMPVYNSNGVDHARRATVK